MRRWIVAVLLAGCGADGPTYDPAPADAVASCSIVQQRRGMATARHELWFDSAGRMIQADGYHGSSTFTYDDQGRLVGAVMAYGDTDTWTYEASQITAVTTHGASSTTDVYALDANARVTAMDGPSGHVDVMHDAAGHLTSFGDPGNAYTYHYDAEGRLAWSDTHPGTILMPTSYSYVVGPAGVEIDLAGDFPRRYTWDFDGAGRVIRVAVDGYGYTYSYDGDRVTAIGDDARYQTYATGVCPGIATTLQPYDPVPIRLDGDVATLPNPPVDEFGLWGN